MLQKYVDIIIDISHEAIDRPFQYSVPEGLIPYVKIGTQVTVPFGLGNRIRSGYVIGISDTPSFDPSKIKEIDGIKTGGIPIESSMIELASFIKEQYGSTMINALKTVMPIKEEVRHLAYKQVNLLISGSEAKEYLEYYQKRNARAKIRLLTELMEEKQIPLSLVTGKLNISSSTLKSMQTECVISIEEESYYRDVIKGEAEIDSDRESPNQEQQSAINRVVTDYENHQAGTYLLKGITGSGKTLVYIEMVEKIVEMGKQAIVLIPEIALTYQTVKRFRKRFGNQVTIMNSKLSKGERYDQFQKAKKGEVSVMIGPRSALFTPFPDLGIIIIDEEHETTYKSEYPPKYHAREVAIERARMTGAAVVLGSATPSVESYYRALKGEYQLLTLEKRAIEEASLANVSVVDLREELKLGNRSIFSKRLQDLIADRLEKKEQIMLFINRRGYSGFISCRSCGHVFRCPHCDVSLTEHFSGTPKAKLVCHYCGYEEKKTASCPKCQSKMIAGFGIGTQKVEEMVKKMYPEARTLRMDTDTTRNKDDYENILNQFANGQADILVGTQMIVKGHDFTQVTLVGIIAADLTLFENDYRSAERTFDLLTQAAGRAGRGNLRGEVVIQTYAPDHYCIEAAAKQDYIAFYEQEKAYRSLLSYPPFTHVLAIFMEDINQEKVRVLSEILKEMIREWGKDNRVQVIGPCDATIAKVNDRYRRVIYLKHNEYEKLVDIKNQTEEFLEKNAAYKEINLSFDFDPMHVY